MPCESVGDLSTSSSAGVGVRDFDFVDSCCLYCENCGFGVLWVPMSIVTGVVLSMFWSWYGYGVNF